MRYFIAGHSWVLFAAAMLIGQTPTNWQYHSRFFGIGAMMSDSFYFACIMFAVAFGVLHLFLAWKTDGPKWFSESIPEELTTNVGG